MAKYIGNKINVLNKGHVTLVDYYGDDSRIVQFARVSYGSGTKTVNDDASLIDYLIRHKHSSPIESVDFTFHVKCPMFIGEQILRHRMGSFNKISARYSVMLDEFYVPEGNEWREQSKTNKQGSEGLIPDGEELTEIVEGIHQNLYEQYESLLTEGVAKEQARGILPANLYTEFYWKVNLRALFNFLELRLDSHAQKEIQVYAQSIYDLIKDLVPVTINSWENHIKDSVTFSKDELEILLLNTNIPSIVESLKYSNLNKSRQKELVEKLGLK